MLRWTVGAACILLYGSPVIAQTTLQGPELDNRIVEANQLRPPRIIGTFTVEGRRIWNAPTLAAQRIIFKPGASLIFSDEVLRNQRRDLFVFADEVISESQERPGEITWEAAIPPAPPPLGTAGAGPDHGSIEGQRGGDGANGRQGTQGTPGSRAPNLTVVAHNISTPLKISLQGGRGGPGGNGENGGRGGGGGYGNPASQSMFDCQRGGGDGAPGGNGGLAGPGGRGGPPGAGGTFTLILPNDNLAIGTRLLQVNTGRGEPGEGGPAGTHGAGGPGGAAGAEARPHCGGGNRGPNGATPTSPQTPGPFGMSEGVPNGAYFVGGLAVADLAILIR